MYQHVRYEANVSSGCWGSVEYFKKKLLPAKYMTKISLKVST